MKPYAIINIRSLLMILVAVSANFAQAQQVNFAVVGDFGALTTEEQQVANLIHGWNPGFILTVGDNNYGGNGFTTPAANLANWDNRIRQYYQDYMKFYPATYPSGNYYAGLSGTNYGTLPAAQTTTNKFFMLLGNHDWDQGINDTTLAAANKHKTQTDYTDTLGGVTVPSGVVNNSRYYTFIQKSGAVSVQFFMLDADPREPDGRSIQDVQGQWFRNAIRQSDATYRVVMFHQPSFTSGTSHTNETPMQWNFKHWGVDAVLTGHVHNYEQLRVDGLPYIVTGNGGQTLNSSGAAIPQSVVQYSAAAGALKATATAGNLTFQEISVVSGNPVIDTVTVSPQAAYTSRKYRTFQQNVNGYTGAVDTYLDSSTPSTTHHADTTIVVDGSPNAHGLVRFDSIFGGGANQIPAGATILSANLTLVTGTTANDNSAAYTQVYRMRQAWTADASLTWNSAFGGDGITLNNIEALSTPDGIPTNGNSLTADVGRQSMIDSGRAGITGSFGSGVNFDVTGSLQYWLAHPTENYGWAVLNPAADANAGDGFRWSSSETGTTSLRPMLDVVYFAAAPEPGTFVLGGIGLIGLIAFARRKRAGARSRPQFVVPALAENSA